MDRNPSPPAPRVYTEAQPSTIYVYADTAKFMETVRRFTGQTAPTNAAAAGATVRMLPLESVQQHQPMLTTATAPGPSASGLLLQLTLSPPLWLGNPGPCVTNKAPDPRSLATSESESTISADDDEMENAEQVEMEEAEEVEMQDAEEVEAVNEGRFYLLPLPQNGGAGEPKLLNLFPLAPSSSEGN